MKTVSKLVLIVSALAVGTGAAAVGVHDYNITQKIEKQERRIEWAKDGNNFIIMGTTTGSKYKRWEEQQPKVIADAKSRILEYEDELIVYRP